MPLALFRGTFTAHAICSPEGTYTNKETRQNRCKLTADQSKEVARRLRAKLRNVFKAKQNKKAKLSPEQEQEEQEEEEVTAVIC